MESEHSQISPHLLRSAYLDFFATDDGFDMLAAFEREHLEKRKRAASENEKHHHALENPREAKLGYTGEHVSVRPEHVGAHGRMDEWECADQVRGADGVCETSRGGDGDVVMRDGKREISFCWSVRTAACWGYISVGIRADVCVGVEASTDDTMGLASLEFGFPFAGKKVRHPLLAG